MKKINQLMVVFTTLLLTFAVIGCDNSNSGSDSNSNSSNKENTTDYRAKYVFMFIGDGMGMPQVFAASDFLGAKADADANVPSTLTMLTFPVSGYSTTYSLNSMITDSAAAGTALACGKKTNSGVISMDATGTTSYTTIAEMAKSQGKKVGIVSSVSIDHATPAVYYTHNETRNDYEGIGKALLNSSFDYFAGGGFRLNKWADSANAYTTIETTAAANGFTLADTRAEFDQLNSNTGRVIAINPYVDGSYAMPYAINRINDSANYSGTISLAEFTEKGIELLDNDNGFFMMVEGGKIDWACHANDAASAIKDTIAFDDAIKVALEFYQKYPEDTIIIVTADHECGGMTNGFANTGYATLMELLDKQVLSFSSFDTVIGDAISDASNALAFNDALPYLKQYFGFSDVSGDALELSSTDLTRLETALDCQQNNGSSTIDSYTYYTMYGGYNPVSMECTHMLNEKAGIGWTSYSHTGVPVPVFAIGAGSELFDGYYDNTDIYKKTVSVMKLKND